MAKAARDRYLEASRDVERELAKGENANQAQMDLLEQMVKITRSNYESYYKELYKVIRHKTRRTGGRSDYDLGDPKDVSVDQIETIMPAIELGIRRQKKMGTWIPGRGDNVSKQHSYSGHDPETGRDFEYKDNEGISDRQLNRLGRQLANITSRLQLASTDARANPVDRNKRERAIQLYRDTIELVKSRNDYISRLRTDTMNVDNQQQALPANSPLALASTFLDTVSTPEYIEKIQSKVRNNKGRAEVNNVNADVDTANFARSVNDIIGKDNIDSIVFASGRTRKVVDHVSNMQNASKRHHLGLKDNAFDGLSDLAVDNNGQTAAANFITANNVYAELQRAYNSGGNTPERKKNNMIKRYREIMKSVSDAYSKSDGVYKTYERAVIAKIAKESPRTIPNEYFKRKDHRGDSAEFNNRMKRIILHNLKGIAASSGEDVDNSIEAKLRGISFDKFISPDEFDPNNPDHVKAAIELARQIVPDIRTMESGRKVFEVEERERHIDSQTQYLKIIALNGATYLWKNQVIPAVKNLPKNVWRGSLALTKSLIKLVKNSISAFNIMRPQTQKEFYKKYIAGKKFGFGQMADKDYFDLAYKESVKIKKVYKENKGTLRKNMVYSEIYMPVTILMKAMFDMLTSGDELDSTFIFLLNCSNKGLEEGFL